MLNGKFMAATVAAATLAVTGSSAATLTTLYSFQGGADGGLPEARLTMDVRGNLYGTTAGNMNNGGKAASTVFMLTHPAEAGGAWTEAPLAVFRSGVTISGGAVLDGSGHVFSTTANGGAFGGGSVVELAPPAGVGAAWTRKTIASFQTVTTAGEVRPRRPLGLGFDPAGDLIGASALAGTATCDDGYRRCGTVWEVSPASSGSGWTQATIHKFHGERQGAYPDGEFVFTATGVAIGTAGGGIVCSHGTGIVHTDCGQIVALAPPATSGGKWTETLLYDFNPDPENNVLTGPDGALPNAGLVEDAAGNAYGTASEGGSGAGIVFELSPPAGGGVPWQETILYSFTVADGHPRTSLAMDSAGNLYGTTYQGGQSGFGTIYELAKPVTGSAWTKTTLYSFATNGNPAGLPAGALIVDAGRNLYGTTPKGGADNKGTVFELTP